VASAAGLRDVDRKVIEEDISGSPSPRRGFPLPGHIFFLSVAFGFAVGVEVGVAVIPAAFATASALGAATG